MPAQCTRTTTQLCCFLLGEEEEPSSQEGGRQGGRNRAAGMELLTSGQPRHRACPLSRDTYGAVCAEYAPLVCEGRGVSTWDTREILDGAQSRRLASGPRLRNGLSGRREASAHGSGGRGAEYTLSPNAVGGVESGDRVMNVSLSLNR